MKNSFFRILSIFLILVLIFCFIVGCSSSDTEVDSYSNSDYSSSSYDDDYDYSSSYDDDDYSSSSSTSGCAYEYSNGSICGASVGSNGVFCTKHKQELDDTYNSLLETLEDLE